MTRLPWFRDAAAISHRRDARARTVDRTVVAPGMIDRMRAEAAGPSPDFRAAIERARRSGMMPAPAAPLVERELSEAQQRAHDRLTEVIDSQVRRTIYEQAAREQFGDVSRKVFGRPSSEPPPRLRFLGPGEAVIEVAGGLVGRVLRRFLNRG